ncbi:MAG: hypothetical protein ACR2PT_13555 [Endozoicomonas sp.]
MGPLGQPELIRRVDTLCQKEVAKQDEVVRLSGKKLLLGGYKGSFRERCTQWLKRTFGKSEFKSYGDYLDSVTARESSALATALAKTLSKRTVKPCTLSGKVTVADLAQTIEKTRRELADFDSIVRQVVKPALKGDPLTSDPLDGPKAVLRTALMDRKISRPEQLQELQSQVSHELKSKHSPQKGHKNLVRKMNLAMKDLALSLELQQEAVEYADRERLQVSLEKKKEPFEQPSEDWVYIEDTPDKSTDRDGMTLKLAKKSIKRPEGYDSASESIPDIVAKTLTMLKKKYPDLAPIHLRNVQDYLKSHFSSNPAPLTTPAPPPEESLNIAGQYKRLPSEADSEASSGVFSDFSRQSSVIEEKDFSGSDQYTLLTDDEHDGLKAERQRLGSDDSGVNLNSEQDGQS